MRWVIVHLMELPENSRIKKHYQGESSVFEVRDHLLADIRDLLLGNQYFTFVGACKEMKPAQQQKVVRGYPKRLPRPGEEPEEKRFATKEELQMLFPKTALKKRQQLLAERQQRKQLRQ